MPEIPDIEVFSYNLKDQYGGKQLAKIKVIDNRRLQDTQEHVFLQR